MATSCAFNERVEAALKKLILDEYPHMKHSSASKFAKGGAELAAYQYAVIAKEDIKGIRSLHFTDLPRELRDRVYHYAVVRHEPIGIGLTDTQRICYRMSSDYRYSGTDTLVQPPITRVSKWMREESLKLFYKNNEFVASLEYACRSGLDAYSTRFRLGDSLCVLKKWLKSIGPANIKNIDNLLLLRLENKDGRAAQTKSAMEACEDIVLPTNTKEVVFSNLQVQTMWDEHMDRIRKKSQTFSSR